MTTQNTKSLRKTRNMTEGSPLRHVLLFAVPLFIGNIFQQVYSMVDTMVAGYTLGDSAIAAIGATSALYTFLMDFTIGLNSGYSIVVTQSFGADDQLRLRRSIAGMLVLNGAATVIMTVLSLALLRPLMLFMNTPAAILEQAYAYMAILCAGMAATVGYNMFAGILRAMGNSRSPLYFLILSSLLNIGLDILLVAGLRMGVAGAALATVIAQAVSAILCGVYIWRNYREVLPAAADFRLPKELVSDLLSTGVAMALMYCVVDAGSVLFQRANNGLGETIIAAHTAARRLIMILMQPLATITTASSTFVGQNWGAKKVDRIRTELRQVMALSIGWSLFAFLLVLVGGGALVRFTTGTTDAFIISNAVLSLRLHLGGFAFLGVLLCLRTAMQAMGHKSVPIASSCLELACKFVSAFLIIPRIGFLGTCLTEPVTWVLMMILLLAAYARQNRQLAAAGCPTVA